MILTDPRLLQSVTARNSTSSRNSVRRNTDSSSVSTLDSGVSSQPRSLLSQRPLGQTLSLRNRINLLRQNQRPTRSNIARAPSTIPRALPPVTPKASRFGDVNMPTVIEAALRRLREQAKTHTHGAFEMPRQPAPHSEVNIARARSPFGFFGSPGTVEGSVSQSSSSSSSSSSSEQSSSETVIQTSNGDSSGVSHSVSSSTSSKSDSKHSSSSSSSHSHSHSHPAVHSHSAGMLHPNLMAARANSAPGISNVQPVVSNLQPELSISRNSLNDDILTNVQPAPANARIVQTNIVPAVPSQTIVQPFVPSIPRATSVLQPVDSLTISGGLQAESVNKTSSTSSKTSAETSSTVVSDGNTSLQSSASSSKSETKTKKTVTTKTVKETTVFKDESATGMIAGGTGVSGIAQPPPVGSITVQRGPGGMSTITLSDGSGEPVVLRASGPVKIERIVNAAGKVQFLINPIKRFRELEPDFEAEEIVNATTQGTPVVPKRSKSNAANRRARLVIPTTTPFPLPWDTTRRPASPQRSPSNNLAQPHMPGFESVLSQISEIANSISNGGGFGSGAELQSSRTDAVMQNNRSPNNVIKESLVPQDPSIISNSFIPSSGAGIIRPPISQTILNPVQGTIPIARTFVNPVVGSAGPVFDSKSSRNRISVMSNVPMNNPRNSNSQAVGNTVSRHLNSDSQGVSNTVDSINTMFSGQINAGPLPPYEIRGQAQNSVPS